MFFTPSMPGTYSRHALWPASIGTKRPNRKRLPNRDRRANEEVGSVMWGEGGFHPGSLYSPPPHLGPVGSDRVPSVRCFFYFPPGR